MKPSDEVRDYVSKHYIVPARAQRMQSVQVRVGDVHAKLGYHNRLPLVCSALTSLKFREPNKLTLIKTDGPGSSTTTTFTFGL
jgi:hypothetical protein